MLLKYKKLINDLVNVIKESIMEEGVITPKELTEYIDILVNTEEVENKDIDEIKDEVLDLILNSKLYLRYIKWQKVG